MQRQKSSGLRTLSIPIFGIAFAIMAAIPGALIGLITGFLGFHLIAAIVSGLFFFIMYPRSRRRAGFKTDLLTYFNAMCGAVGGGVACYFVGSLVD